jgi:competence protein ComEA
MGRPGGGGGGSGGATAYVAAIGLVVAAVGGLARWRWPSAEPALPCAPEQVRWVDAGERWLATCEPGPPGPVPAGQALALGRTLDLNSAGEADLSAVPGVGPHLARALVEARARRGGFRSWEEVDEVPGVGPAKLELLRQSCHLTPPVR